MESLSPCTHICVHIHIHTHTYCKHKFNLSRGFRSRDSNLEVISKWAADLEKMPTPKEGGSSALTAHED